MKTIFIFVLLLSFTVLKAQDTLNVDPSIAFISSGGYWETNGSSGTYRIIVVNSGFEHVSSKLYIQWIQEDSEHHQIIIRQSVLVKEISNGNWSLGQPQIQLSKSGAKFIISGTNPYSLEENKWIFQLSIPGKYLLKE